MVRNIRLPIDESKMDLITLHFSQKAVAFIEKNEIKEILLDVHYIKEACLEIRNPIVYTSNDEDIEIFSIGYDGDLKCSYSDEFSKQFGAQDAIQKIEIDVKGIMKKNLQILNVEPTIINVCNS